MTPVASHFLFFLTRRQCGHWGESDCFGSSLFTGVGQASVLSRRVSLIAGKGKRRGKKMKEKGNVAAAKHLEVAFFTLSVFPLFFSSPHVIVFCINPFTSLRASRRLVCFFFFTFFNPR